MFTFIFWTAAFKLWCHVILVYLLLLFKFDVSRFRCVFRSQKPSSEFWSTWKLLWIIIWPRILKEYFVSQHRNMAILLYIDRLIMTRQCVNFQWINQKKRVTQHINIYRSFLKMIYLHLYKCSARVFINKLTDTKTFLHVSHSMYLTPVAIVVTWFSREICLVSDKKRVTFRSISKVH